MSADPVKPVPVSLQLPSRQRRLPAGERRLWRSLDELENEPAFLDYLHREFPEQASVFEDPEGRREFLKVMGASLALAGLTGCTRQPTEVVVPYVKLPENLVPGKPLFFATALVQGGYAQGVLVESHLGRPTKIEGNPEHPLSLGATDAQGQAEILNLYDPDRAQTTKFQGEVRPWAEFLAALRGTLDLESRRGVKGTGVRLLTGAVTSPTLLARIEDFLKEWPGARWHRHEAVSRDNVREGSRLAFGRVLEPRYRFAEADVVLTFDADLVSEGPARLRAIREIASRRKLEGATRPMSRLYAIESSPTLFGAQADHRLSVTASAVEGLARAVAAGLGLPVEGASSDHAAWVGAMVKDLQARGGAAVVVAGETQPPAVHALAHAINERLGSVGRTVSYAEPAEAAPAEGASLGELAADMHAGKVELLVILDANPVYDAPADLDFVTAMDKVGLRVQLSLYEDETTGRCQWHVPAAHSLESWGDARAADGTASIVQPLIAPLYGGKTAVELLSALLGAERSAYDLVREHWQAQGPAAGEAFEAQWRRWLHDGLVAGTERPAAPAKVALGDWARTAAPAPAGGMELIFRPDPGLHDGRYANNGWLQELAKPLSKLTWDNAALLSPATAQRLGLAAPRETPHGTVTEVVELRIGGRKVQAPAWILPGHPDEAVTVHLGHGRTSAGRVGNGTGFNAYALRTADRPWFASGLEVARTGLTTRLSCTQNHWSIEGRNLVRSVDVADYEKDHHVVAAMGHEPAPELDLYQGSHSYPDRAWGLSIDLNSCVGCNACVVACQSENNIPVVGKAEVGRGREMQWIRVDRYFEGPPEAPETYFQPVPCMHCENAPCEVVCPVAATVHSEEGLNDMVYNRCVGTRYCSNNCPYKVRRFNFFLYQDWTTPTFKMMRNPDVTVRSRGVMEKCTYCVQRISEKRIQAKNEGRPIRDGELQTACQQVCPAEAIVFGDVNDKESRVSKLKASPRNYGLLTELQTKPRTTYLAEVKNPNPEMPRARG
jgi:molybdopterin-containing oxidoreductase family iron-sulfur binding subunit